MQLILLNIRGPGPVSCPAGRWSHTATDWSHWRVSERRVTHCMLTVLTLSVSAWHSTSEVVCETALPDLYKYQSVAFNFIIEYF